jgi:tryptophan synthase alpha chain
VSTPDQAREVAEYADGVIVGTAVVKAIEDASDPVGSLTALVEELAAAVRRS